MTRRDVLLSAMLGGNGALALAIGWRHHPANPQTARVLEHLPAVAGRWRMGDPGSIILPPEDALSRTLYDGYVVRGYEAPGTPRIVLLIAYSVGQSYAMQLHRPEICYPSSGFDVERRRDIEMASIPSTFLSARRGDTVEHVLYWTRIGKEFPRSVWAQRFAIANSALRARSNDAVLVRMSLRGGAPEAAGNDLIQFAKTSKAALSRDQRRLLY